MTIRDGHGELVVMIRGNSGRMGRAAQRLAAGPSTVTVTVAFGWGAGGLGLGSVGCKTMLLISPSHEKRTAIT